MADANYSKYTTSFAGTDMVISFVFPNVAPIVIGTASTINYSIFRQMSHVRTIGRISSKGYARGGRTCAGTIVFTVINESFVQDIKRQVPYLKNINKLKPDELPPFDIVCTLGNEYGQSASLAIYGVSFVDEQKTLSIEDIITENVISFLARDVIHMSGDAFANQIGSMGLRTDDEPIGKFTLANLEATADEKARLARLQELAKQEAKRWDEPVMTSPGMPPKAPASSGGGGKDSVYIPADSNLRSVQWTVKTSDNPPKYISTFKVTCKEGSKSLSPKSSNKSKGQVVYHCTVGKTYTFTFTASGYKSVVKSVKVAKGDSVIAQVVEMVKAITTPNNNDPAANEQLSILTLSIPSKYSGITSHLIDAKISGGKTADLLSGHSGIGMKLMNAKGSPLSSVKVDWSYKILNYQQVIKDIGVGIYKTVAGKHLTKLGGKFADQWGESGSLGSTYSGADGIADFPDVNHHRNVQGVVPKRVQIEITGKPHLERGSTQKANKKFYRSFYIETT